MPGSALIHAVLVAMIVALGLVRWCAFSAVTVSINSWPFPCRRRSSTLPLGEPIGLDAIAGLDW
jgi:hypothetical protein